MLSHLFRYCKSSENENSIYNYTRNSHWNRTHSSSLLLTIVSVIEHFLILSVICNIYLTVNNQQQHQKILDEFVDMWRRGDEGLLGCLGEGEPSALVGVEDLLDGVDVGGGAQINAQVVLDDRAHDGPGGSLHGIVEARVDDV